MIEHVYFSMITTASFYNYYSRRRGSWSTIPNMLVGVVAAAAAAAAAAALLSSRKIETATATETEPETETEVVTNEGNTCQYHMGKVVEAGVVVSAVRSTAPSAVRPILREPLLQYHSDD